jgi:MtrB/PioB family decaheme-associated outer membrane protein
MKNIILTASFMALAASGWAQDKPKDNNAKPAQAAAPMSEDWKAGTLSLGAQQTDSDTISSKFTEYREVPNGAVAPYFRFQGKKNDLRYDFIGENVQQTDQRFRMRLGEDKWKLLGEYNRIPHNFGNAGRTLLEQTSEGVFRMSDTLQQSFQNTLEATNPRTLITYPFLLALVQPSLAAANSVDIKLSRERGNVAFVMTPSEPVEFRVVYSRERRTGTAAAGTAFGFGNVVETPEPVHYLTEDFGVEGQYQGGWGLLRGAVRFNRFGNKIESLTFDNPFRGVDSTDSGAYQAPGSASVGGAAVGRMALPPDSESMLASASVMFKMRNRTRLTADVSLGEYTQNKSPFLAYSSNTAIVSPLVATNPASLPARNLDGKVDVTSLNLYFTSQPVTNLSLTARFRGYDFDNQTPRITFPGYVRFDGYWNAVPRISVPYSYKNDRFDATLGYRFGDLSLEGGFKHIKMERTFRETEDTKENAFSVSASLHTADWLVFRGSYEKADRDFEHLEIEHSEHASFVGASSVTNLLAVLPTTLQTNGQPLCPAGTVCNLRYDQARKDSERIGAHAALSPSDKVTISAGYLRTNDDYKESLFGLISAEFDSLSVDLDFNPNENANLYAYYSYEKLADYQIARQSGATPSNNPLDNWTSTVNDKTNSMGAGGNFVLVPDKWFLNLSGQYQKVDGNNSLFAAAGGAPANARVGVGGVQSIPLYDDMKITTISVRVPGRLVRGLRVQGRCHQRPPQLPAGVVLPCCQRWGLHS